MERFGELRFREWVGLSAKRRGRRKLIGPAPFSLGRLLPAEKNWFRLTNEIRTERVPLDSMIRGHFLGARPPARTLILAPGSGFVTCAAEVASPLFLCPFVRPIRRPRRRRRLRAATFLPSFSSAPPQNQFAASGKRPPSLRAEMVSTFWGAEDRSRVE